MKLSQMIAAYRPSVQAKLKKKIKLDDGTVFKAGTVSEILIQKEDETYHFEANGSACKVKKTEIIFI